MDSPLSKFHTVEMIQNYLLMPLFLHHCLLKHHYGCFLLHKCQSLLRNAVRCLSTNHSFVCIHLRKIIARKYYCPCNRRTRL